MSAVSPFTNSVASEIWGYKEGKSIYTCPDTRALFFDRKSLSKIDYQDYYPYLKDFDDQRIEWELSIRRRNYRRQLQHIEQLATGMCIVDVGAGPGYLCRIAEDMGWTSFGVELSDQARKIGRDKLGVKYTALEDFDENSIDAMICHHILEHLFEPMKLLDTLHAKLKNSGLLVVHVPHQQPLSQLAKYTFHNLGGKNTERHCALYGNEHVSGFTQSSLRAVLELAGFETHFIKSVDMWTRYYDPFFLRNYLRQQNYGGILKSLARHAINSVGIPFGRGDWIVGYFYKNA